MTPSTPSRRFQFSLRTMFIALVLASLAFGWWVNRSRAWIRERQETLAAADGVTLSARITGEKKAPWNLALFGETGVDVLYVPHAEQEHFQRLFPEARVMSNLLQSSILKPGVQKVPLQE
jgi:hypothetical protein